eukprot:TRINITY_DN3719_c0_g1_i4.p6 TRINITY_DN3719_c0_g1~~TRINITY_DN3719_c0_g1_i4.p6  ORF type:complete len:111 (+),score=1.63 TRINITY_DN3719_c0_g1_i4:1708-2040(+)
MRHDRTPSRKVKCLKHEQSNSTTLLLKFVESDQEIINYTNQGERVFIYYHRDTYPSLAFNRIHDPSYVNVEGLHPPFLFVSLLNTSTLEWRVTRCKCLLVYQISPPCTLR